MQTPPSLSRNDAPIFDRGLIARYNVNGPRYTSYPTAPQFTDFSADRLIELIQDGNDDPIPSAVSLYVHVPFCKTVCFYCACNKIITANYRRAEQYLVYLKKELALLGEHVARDRVVEQLHFGGGTPTYLKMTDLAGLMRSIGRHLTLDDAEHREFSIEIDPRTVDAAGVHALANMGFNRMSLGVQDVDERVQKASNRIQSLQNTETVLTAARDAGFRSINMDLIYGLPQQTMDSFANTLAKIIAMRPDRLAVYNYAHMPEIFKVQRQIDPTTLPTPDTKLSLLELAIDRLTAAGYEYIGMDHFALPDDELAQARRNGTLQRNFQGYSTRAEYDMLGVGSTSIGSVRGAYYQNARDMNAYMLYLDADRLPVVKGFELDADDLLRRTVINQLMCHGGLDFRDVETRFHILFKNYFRDELHRLDAMAEDGLIAWEKHGLRIEPRGRLLLRNIAMVFDRYLNREKQTARFSRAV